jgi:NAD(P)-dependent dehydrogenase (short-subunit alcohol dehydrogenase family)
MKDLNQKRFIVAGGTGMGAAIAVRLVRQGSRIVVGDINRAGLDSLLPQLTGEAGRGVVVPFDLADETSIGPLVQRCVDEYGGIDGLAITAADLSKATLEGFTVEERKKVYGGNAAKVYNIARQLFKRAFEGQYAFAR